MTDIAFLLPNTTISGGVNIILSHGLQLAREGHVITFVTKNAVDASDVHWHPICADFIGSNLRWRTFVQVQDNKFDFVIVTLWATLFDAWKLQAEKYLYFVQSIESRFFPSSNRLMRNVVEATYQLPLGFITVSGWMARYLEKIHHQHAIVVPNGINKALFQPTGPVVTPRNPGRLRVLVEGAVDVWFKNVPRAIELARGGGCDEVWLLTSSAITQFNSVDRIFSQVPLNKTPEIYRSCDVLLKLSWVEGMFGPPLEMFHCGGTAIVYDVSGHEDYIVNGVNALVAEVGDEKRIIALLRQLRTIPQLLAGLRSQALDTALRWPDWTESARNFSAAISEAAQGATITQDQLRAHADRLYQFTDTVHRLPPAESQLQSAYARINELDRTIKEIKGSRSWKATAPFRNVSRFFRRLARRRSTR